MKVVISVVSHGHEHIIKKLKSLDNLSEDFNVVIKSNKPGDDFSELSSKSKFHWINNEKEYNLGFGENNNVIYRYCVDNLNLSSGDYFLVVNPDVSVQHDTVLSLVKRMTLNNDKVACLNLYKDEGFTIYDNSVRSFPSLTNYISSFLGLRNDSIINKSNIDDTCKVDWAAGSFLAFEAQHYKNLDGFDERYFMYCEDIDICFRSHILGESVSFYPDLKALHLAEHANRKVFSRHFYWHLNSVFRFLLTKYTHRT
ncbi:glycosyltransferase family 2 protein [Vibrio celticus]|uniref:glycosyltransferase family 2 protein n=1 Tax=Vibrio celticus TaxID=446372 RepID=UPI00406902DD